MLLKDLDEFDRVARVGDWAFAANDTHIAIQLYEGWEGVAMLPIKDGSHWTWDGNREAPTLTPSILHWGGGRGQPATWHGYLRAGKLETT